MLGPKKLIMAGAPLDRDARAYIARMSVRPDRARQTLISDTVKALKSAGIWQTLDALYLFAAHSEQAALLNVMETRFSATKSSAVAFAVDSGFTTTSSANINTNLALNASPRKIAQTSASAAIFIVPARGATFLTGANSTIRNDSGSSQYRLFRGSGNIAAVGQPTTDVLEHVTRSGTTSVAYRDGQQVGSNTASPESPGTTPFELEGASIRHRVAAIGSHITAEQAASLNTILRSYLTSIGAPA